MSQLMIELASSPAHPVRNRIDHRNCVLIGVVIDASPSQAIPTLTFPRERPQALPLTDRDYPLCRVRVHGLSRAARPAKLPCTGALLHGGESV